MTTKTTQRRTGGRVRSTRQAEQYVTVRNVNVPGYTSRVNAEKYAAMYRALMRVLPAKEPGLTQAEMFNRVIPLLPPKLFPGGAKAGWWAKTVQLDLEAKGEILREQAKPLRWHRKGPR